MDVDENDDIVLADSFKRNHDVFKTKLINNQIKYINIVNTKNMLMKTCETNRRYEMFKLVFLLQCNTF